MKYFRTVVLITAALVGVSVFGGCTTQNKLAEQSASKAMVPPLSAAPAWFACEADTDCTVQEGLCQSQTAVNKNFIKDFIGYRDQMNPTLACSAKEEPPPMNVGCVQKRCTLKPEDIARPAGP